jgi:hypothetical protein
MAFFEETMNPKKYRFLKIAIQASGDYFIRKVGFWSDERAVPPWEERKNCRQSIFAQAGATLMVMTLQTYSVCQKF